MPALFLPSKRRFPKPADNRIDFTNSFVRASDLHAIAFPPMSSKTYGPNGRLGVLSTSQDFAYRGNTETSQKFAIVADICRYANTSSAWSSWLETAYQTVWPTNVERAILCAGSTGTESMGVLAHNTDAVTSYLSFGLPDLNIMAQYAISIDATTSSAAASYYKNGVYGGNLNVQGTFPWDLNPRTATAGSSALGIGAAYVALFGPRRTIPIAVLLAEMARNPYQVLRSSPRLIFVQVNIDLTLTMQDLSHGQLLDNLGLVQQASLITSDLLQSQALENTELTQQNILLPGAVSQAQLLGIPELIQQNTLDTAAMSQAQLLGGADLIQQNTLLPAGVQQAQLLGTPVLTQQNTLAVADEMQAQVLQAPSLTQQNVVAPVALSQAQTISTVSLPTGTPLTTADITQAQLLEGLSLVQQNTLAVADLSQAQNLEVFGLTQHSSLAVNAILQSQVLGEVNLSSALAVSVDNLISQQALDSVALTQANLLICNALQQGQIVDNAVLSQYSILVVDDLLHAQLLSGVAVHDGAVPLTVRGSTVFVLRGSGFPVFVVSSHSNVFVTK